MRHPFWVYFAFCSQLSIQLQTMTNPATQWSVKMVDINICDIQVWLPFQTQLIVIFLGMMILIKTVLTNCWPLLNCGFNLNGIPIQSFGSAHAHPMRNSSMSWTRLEMWMSLPRILRLRHQEMKWAAVLQHREGQCQSLQFPLIQSLRKSMARSPRKLKVPGFTFDQLNVAYSHPFVYGGFLK